MGHAQCPDVHILSAKLTYLNSQIYSGPTGEPGSCLETSCLKLQLNPQFKECQQLT